MTERMPAQTFHPSVFILDEMEARGWSIRDVAERMPGDLTTNMLAVYMYLSIGPHEPGIRIDAAHYAHAFDVAPEFFRKLEGAWLRSVGAYAHS